MEGTPDANVRWRKLLRRLNPVQKHVKDLRQLLEQAEESNVVETVDQSSGKGLKIGNDHAGLKGNLSKRTERQSEFRARKQDHLERFLTDYKQVLTRSIADSRYDAAFVLVDDFYLIPREHQPDVVDYLHRLLRGTDLYMKIGSVRHRTSLMRQVSHAIGVELHQDVEEISLDTTLEDLEVTSEHLSRMLDALSYSAEIDNPKESLFNPEAFHSLVLASGGVPRDFLNIFVEAIDNASAEGKIRWLTPTHIWKGAGRISYRTKLGNLRDEAEADASPLEKVYYDIVSFCLKEKKKTAFLVSQHEAQAYPDIHELILQLMDFKLIHVVEPDTSAASGRKGRYEAYTLDWSLFMEPRMRNIEHVEFWRIDADGRRVGLREAPDYSLLRAREATNGKVDTNIEAVLQEANQTQ